MVRLRAARRSQVTERSRFLLSLAAAATVSRIAARNSLGAARPVSGRRGQVPMPVRDLDEVRTLGSAELEEGLQSAARAAGLGPLDRPDVEHLIGVLTSHVL